MRSIRVQGNECSRRTLMACLQQRFAQSAFDLFNRPLLKDLCQFAMGMLTFKNELQRNQSWRNLQLWPKYGQTQRAGIVVQLIGETALNRNWNKAGYDKINVPLALGLILGLVKWSVALAEFSISVPKRDWSWLILSIEQTRFPAFAGLLSHAVLDVKVKGGNYDWLVTSKTKHNSHNAQIGNHPSSIYTSHNHWYTQKHIQYVFRRMLEQEIITLYIECGREVTKHPQLESTGLTFLCCTRTIHKNKFHSHQNIYCCYTPAMSRKTDSQRIIHSVNMVLRKRTK